MKPLVQEAGDCRALAQDIADGRLTALDLVERCLARIDAVEGEVRAWVTVLADSARAEARALDATAQAGRLRGPLHGIPFGVKDVIDIGGLRTRANSPARDEWPIATADATVVAHLRAAGGVLLGKLHTTELAFYEAVPPTRNPHDTARTAGGSSSGSGAAVAAGMVPLALGTQTAGSVNRPAAYCGVGAFKPSTLAIGGFGMLALAPSFDTVGAFGATASDAALLAAGYAGAHLWSPGQAARTPRRVVKLRDPLFERAAPATKAAVAALAARLAAGGVEVTNLASPLSLETIVTEHRVVMLAELGRLHRHLPREVLGKRLAEGITEGLTISDEAYHAALHALKQARTEFWAGIDPLDLLLVPAAPDVAPVGMATGDPTFIIPFTALGGPIATVRAGMADDSGMPVGALVAGAPGTDAMLGAWLAERGL